MEGKIFFDTMKFEIIYIPYIRRFAKLYHYPDVLLLNLFQRRSRSEFRIK